MNLTRRTLYRSFFGGIRLYQKVFLKLHVWGRESIPDGPKIFAQNYITTTDPFWVLPILPEPVHVIIGPGYQSKPLATVFDLLEQINATPRHRKTVVDKAVSYIQRGESVYTAPEGGIQPIFELGRYLPGVAKIYRRTRAPIVPIALLAPRSAIRARPLFDVEVDGRLHRNLTVLRGPYCISFGEPFRPEVRENADETEECLRIMGELRDRTVHLIEDIRVNKFWL